MSHPKKILDYVTNSCNMLRIPEQNKIVFEFLYFVKKTKKAKVD